MVLSRHPCGGHGDCRREWTPEDTSPNRAVRIIAKPSLAGREAFPAGTVANERIRRFAVTRKASRGVGFARHAGSPESWPGLSRPSTPCSLSCRKKDVDAREDGVPA